MKDPMPMFKAAALMLAIAAAMLILQVTLMLAAIL